jgi:HSP20 family protein
MFEIMPRLRYGSELVGPTRNILDWFFEDLSLPDFWQGDEQWLPAFDLAETADEIVVRAELPGMEAKDIEITLTDDLLTISGEKKRDKEDRKENYHRLERQYGSFSRSICLPAAVKGDAIDASYKDGVLTVTLPKTEEQKPRRIEIES